ncbi:hypothetical protein M3231_07230 [Neobacillus mesonae]|nr:hypothetical protein [Neobacillus mesonae]
MKRRVIYTAVINALIASLVIVGLTEASYAASPSDHTILNLSVFLLFPGLFLLQGIACSLFRSSKVIALGASSIVYLVYFVFRYTNGFTKISDYTYILGYLLIGWIGYLITECILIIRRPSEQKQRRG